MMPKMISPIKENVPGKEVTYGLAQDFLLMEIATLGFSLLLIPIFEEKKKKDERKPKDPYVEALAKEKFREEIKEEKKEEKKSIREEKEKREVKLIFWYINPSEKKAEYIKIEDTYKKEEELKIEDYTQFSVLTKNPNYALLPVTKPILREKEIEKSIQSLNKVEELEKKALIILDKSTDLSPKSLEEAQKNLEEIKKELKKVREELKKADEKLKEARREEVKAILLKLPKPLRYKYLMALKLGKHPETLRLMILSDIKYVDNLLNNFKSWSVKEIKKNALSVAFFTMLMKFFNKIKKVKA